MLGFPTDYPTPASCWNSFIQGSDLLGAQLQVLHAGADTEAKPAVRNEPPRQLDGCAAGGLARKEAACCVPGCL
jgi:hypothetical protein